MLCCSSSLTSVFIFQSSTSNETPEQSDVDQSEKGKPTENQSDSGGDDTTSYTKTDDSMSDSSPDSKSAENDKSSDNEDSDVNNDIKVKKYDSSDSTTPPPPVLTPIRKRGRPPGRPPGSGRGRGSVLRHIQGAVRKPRGAKRGRGGSGRGILRGIRKGLARGHSKTRGVGLMRGLGRGLVKSPVRGLGRGRGGGRGRGIRPTSLLKVKMKTERPVGRPKKIPHESSLKPSEKTNTHKSDTKSPQKRNIFDFKTEKSKLEIERKRDSSSSMQGVSILEHEPDLMDDEDFDDDDIDEESFMEHHVDPRNYWCPPANVKTLLDQVCITDVTTSSGTITFRECSSETGFFKKKELECS